MRAMHAVMSTQTPMAARSPERRRLGRPVRAPSAVATAPHTARARAATVAPYPSSGIIGILLRPDRLRSSVASSGRWPSSGMPLRPDRRRGSVASSGRWPSSRALATQALHQLLVSGLRAIVGSLVLLRVLGEDERGLEVALPRPRTLDDGAAPLGEEIRRRPLVLDGDVGLAVREGEGEIEALGLPLERAGEHEPAQAVGLARYGRGEELARRDEVDDALAHSRPDEIGDGHEDDEPAHHELAPPAHAPLRAPRAARVLARPARRRQ